VEENLGDAGNNKIKNKHTCGGAVTKPVFKTLYSGVETTWAR
jgi:hypothetical protein